MFPIIPDEDSSLSSLLTNQSKLRENWVQLFLFPRINAAAGHKESMHESNFTGEKSGKVFLFRVV